MPPAKTYEEGELDPDAYTARTLGLVSGIIEIVFIFLILLEDYSMLKLGGIGQIFYIGIPIFYTIWAIADYFSIYKALNSVEKVDVIRGRALILGILQLIFGGIIPGILLLIARSKLTSSMKKRGQWMF